MAEYLNPVSVAQMHRPGQVDINLPGAGYSLYGGYQQGIDTGIAQGLLGLAAQQQQQELLKQQQEYQQANLMNPLLLDKTREETESMKAGTEQTKTKTKGLQTMMDMDTIGFMSSAADEMRKMEVQGDYEGARAFYGGLMQHARKLFPSYKFTVDDFNYEPVKTVRKLKALTVAADNYNTEQRLRSQLEREKVTSGETIAREEMRSRENIAKWHNANALEIANISANAKLETEKNPNMASLYLRFTDIAGRIQDAIDNKTTPKVSQEEVAFYKNFFEFAKTATPQYAAQAGYAGEKAQNEMEGVFKALDDIKNTLKKGREGTPQGTKQPTITPIQKPPIAVPLAPDQESNENILKNKNYSLNKDGTVTEHMPEGGTTTWQSMDELKAYIKWKATRGK